MNFTWGDLEKVQEKLKNLQTQSSGAGAYKTEPMPVVKGTTDCTSKTEAEQRLEELNRQLQNGELLVLMADEEDRYKGGQSLESTLMPTIKVKYHDKDMPRIERLPQGDWIDLVLAEDVKLNAGNYGMFSLGISMELPPGYEAHLVPRSSTYKKWGVLQINSPAIIDNSFCGDDDIWHWLIYAPNKGIDVYIPKYTRVCQFRLVEKQPFFPIVEVEKLNNKTRGMVGSTGE